MRCQGTRELYGVFASAAVVTGTAAPGCKTFLSLARMAVVVGKSQPDSLPLGQVAGSRLGCCGGAAATAWCIVAPECLMRLGVCQGECIGSRQALLWPGHLLRDGHVWAGLRNRLGWIHCSTRVTDLMVV